MVTSDHEEKLKSCIRAMSDLEEKLLIAYSEFGTTIRVYQRRRGTKATIVAYRVFAKQLKWCDEKGHGSVAANAKDHVFSERVTTTSHE